MKKIIVFGGGQVGSSVAKILSDDGNDITLVDYDKDVLDDLKEKMDIKTVHGLASYPSIQKMADAENSDMIIAVTGSDEVNMAACHIAKTVYKVPKRIARLRANEYLRMEEGFDKSSFSINDVISPNILLTDYVKNILDHPGAFQAFNFASGLVKVIAATVLPDGPLSGKNLSEFKKHMPNVDVKVAAIYRDKKYIIPNGDTPILPEDDVFFIATEENMRFMSELKKSTEKPHNVIIAGGGRVGSALAKKLETIYDLKLIEKDQYAAKKVAETLSSTVVLNNDIADETLLKNENIEDVDYFCAVTNDDQMNILSAKLAKDMGAKKTIAIVNKTNYNLLQDSLNIDDLVDPRMTTVSRIMEHVHRGTIGTVYSLLDGEYEFIEAKILEKSELLNKKIKDSNLPDDIRIGAVVRKDQVIIPRSNFIFEKNDLVVFLAKREELKAVESIFSLDTI